MKKLLFAMLFCMAIGCSEEPKWEKISDTNIDDIIVVLMNNPKEYTVFKKTEKELVPITIGASDAIRVFTDVPADKPMYANIKRFEDKNTPEERRLYNRKTKAEIHIHSETDLIGGEWKQTTGGKYPRTTTGKVLKVE